jgi:hypothetical protein
LQRLSLQRNEKRRNEHVQHPWPTSAMGR